MMKKILIIILVGLSSSVYGQTDFKARVGQVIRDSVTVTDVTATSPLSVTGSGTKNVEMTKVSASTSGYLSTGTDTIAGAKRFTGDMTMAANKTIYKPTAAATLQEIIRPTAYSGAMDYKVQMSNASNGDGTYNSPVVSGFNAYGAQDANEGGNYTSMEPDYRPGGAKYKEYHYEVYHPYNAEVSRLFSSTYVQRDSMANSTNQWDFRGHSISFYPLKGTPSYASFGGNYSDKSWSAAFTSLNSTSGIRFSGNGSAAEVYMDGYDPVNTTLYFRNWQQLLMPDSIRTKTIYSSSANGVYIGGNLNIIRVGSNNRLNFNYDGGTTNYGYINLDNGSGEMKHYVNTGGFFQTFYGNGVEKMRVNTNGVGVGTTAPSSVLHTTSFATAYTASGINITLTAAHQVMALTATGLTATLPTAVGITGRIYTIKLTASGTGTVATTSSQTIDGATTYSLASQYKYVTVQSDGANWNIIGNN